jgi:DNA polymerase I-like protein with 3'-5' exonuclease and polymerase domains
MPKATWVGHNVIGFDVPVLERLWGVVFDRETVLDTLVLSRLADPSRSGGHSLRNWGNLLGFPKGDHNDWSQLSSEMIDYCMQDVDVTEAVHKRLMADLDGFSDMSIDLEHRVSWIINEQQRNGWLLNFRYASELMAEMLQRQKEIENELQAVFPPIVEERWSEKTGKRLKDKVTVFNPASRQQVAERLLSKGAVWSDVTPSGRPQVDESTLKPLQHIPEVALVLEYLTLQKRSSMVKSWLEHADPVTDRVHGRVNPCGAVTGRMTHQSPNMAQITARGVYGAESRSCWIVPKGKKLVGFDASGLELRMLAHYMGDEEYTNEILNGDIHTTNQTAAGLSERSQAKTFIYAFLYGAGDAKIGSVVGGSAKDGRALKQRFLRNTPALEYLRERVTRACSRGHLIGLDGRKLWVRSEHSALNTLLQASGAVVMKKALILLDDAAKELGFDYKFIGNIHDEIQTEVDEQQAEDFGKLAVSCIVQAGQQFGLRCPLDGEYKIGDNWSETH